METKQSLLAAIRGASGKRITAIVNREGKT
jgi:hypothetical protein